MTKSLPLPLNGGLGTTLGTKNFSTNDRNSDNFCSKVSYSKVLKNYRNYRVIKKLNIYQKKLIFNLPKKLPNNAEVLK